MDIATFARAGCNGLSRGQEMSYYARAPEMVAGSGIETCSRSNKRDRVRGRCCVGTSDYPGIRQVLEF